MPESSRVPNPGSPEARALKCICPVLDNHHGEGFMMNGERVWWRATGCPLHDPPKAADGEIGELIEAQV